MKTTEIKGQKIGKNYSPFIIAEMSGNHNQSLERALEIVEVAAKAGVSALKHFTLDSSDGGVNSVFSMEPEEIQQLVMESKKVWQALGKISYGPTEAEQKSTVYRRSLYVVQDIESGELLTPENIRAIRPGYGLPPKYYDTILGKQAKIRLKWGTPLSWEIIG